MPPANRTTDFADALTRLPLTSYIKSSIDLRRQNEKLYGELPELLYEISERALGRELIDQHLTTMIGQINQIPGLHIQSSSSICQRISKQLTPVARRARDECQLEIVEISQLSVDGLLRLAETNSR
jgi:hypothetical protein